MAAKNTCTSALRAVAGVSTLSAAIAIGTGRETASFSNFSIKTQYKDLTTYWCFLVVNVVVCTYSFGLLLLPAKSLLWRLIVAIDAILTVLLASSSSAALAVIYLEKSGNFHAGWQPICGHVPNYCNHIIGAIAICFLGVLMLLVLLLVSINNVLNPLLVQKV